MPRQQLALIALPTDALRVDVDPTGNGWEWRLRDWAPVETLHGWALVDSGWEPSMASASAAAADALLEYSHCIQC